MYCFLRKIFILKQECFQSTCLYASNRDYKWTDIKNGFLEDTKSSSYYKIIGN